MKNKIIDNLYCSSDSNVITKKFWSHIKSKTKCNRIPEVLKHNNSISSHNLTKANMFNKYFYEQFSNGSSYTIDIDFTDDNLLDNDFQLHQNKKLTRQR